MKQLLLLLLLTTLATADTVLLSTGKTVNGKIISFNANTGLLLDSEYGEITIKPANIASFHIDQDTEMKEVITTTFEDSKLKNKHKLTFDFSSLDVDTIQFDQDYEGIQQGLIIADNSSKGAVLIMGSEELGMDNGEYFDFYIKNLKTLFVSSSTSKRKKAKHDGIEVITQTIGGEIKGYNLTYSLNTFTKNDINYRIIYWGITSIFDNVIKTFEPFIETIEEL